MRNVPRGTINLIIIIGICKTYCKVLFVISKYYLYNAHACCQLFFYLTIVVTLPVSTRVIAVHKPIKVSKTLEK